MLRKAVRLSGGTAVEPFPWTVVAAPASPGGRPSPTTSGPSDAEDAARLGERIAMLERDAFVKGYAQGERSGAEAASRQGEVLLRRLAQAIEESAAQRADLMRRTEGELVRLALAIAARIVRREVSIDPELLVTMAKVAIDRLADKASATIRLNPVDHAAFRAASGTVPGPGPVEVVADPMVSRGGCLVRSAFGVMDLAIDAQVAEISRALFGTDDTNEKSGGAPVEPDAAGVAHA